MDDGPVDYSAKAVRRYLSVISDARPVFRPLGKPRNQPDTVLPAVLRTPIRKPCPLPAPRATQGTRTPTWAVPTQRSSIVRCSPHGPEREPRYVPRNDQEWYNLNRKR